MINIQKYADVEPDFFKGRAFGESNEVVTSVLEEVQKRGDAALRLYGQKFDVAVPAQFEVPQEELQAAAEKLRIEKRDVYDAIVYSHDLALRFAKLQKKSFKDFEEELEPGLFTGQKTIPVDTAGCNGWSYCHDYCRNQRETSGRNVAACCVYRNCLLTGKEARLKFFFKILK